MKEIERERERERERASTRERERDIYIYIYNAFNSAPLHVHQLGSTSQKSRTFTHTRMIYGPLTIFFRSSKFCQNVFFKNGLETAQMRALRKNMFFVFPPGHKIERISTRGHPKIYRRRAEYGFGEYGFKHRAQ